MHAITINPVNQEAINLMGIAALQNKDYAMAQENFVHSLILNPANDISRENLNNFCIKQGRDIVDVIYDQGVSWQNQKQIQKAAFAFITSLKLNPANTKARELLDNCMSQF
jgi:Flp pilus assembly protein TadD